MVQSVQKALRLLQLLDQTRDWIGVRELARQLALSPPATHSLLKTLRAAGFVEANALTRQYRLGLAAVRLGAGADPLKKIRSFSRPFIEELAAQFDETIVVLAWQNEQAHVVDWIQAGHSLAVTHHHGVVEHPIGFASGRVLLAYQDRDTQERHAGAEDFTNLGANAPRNAEELRAVLAKVAADGCAVTRNIGNSGVVAVGAPVFDAIHQLVVAVGCSAPISRMPATRLAIVRKRLTQLTGTMTRSLQAGPPRSTSRARG